jgi:glycosyltransferase involved in cell wall biosynthesis
VKTLQISDDLDPNSSEGRRVLTISEGLVQRGHDVTLVTALKNLGEKDKIEKIVDPKVKILWHEPLFRFSKFSFSPKLYEILSEQDYDVVHAHSYRHYGTYVGSLLRKKKNIPFVISPYGSTGYESSIPFKPLYLVQDLLTRKYPVKYPDKILAETKYEKSQITRFGGDPEKIKVVYRDVDTNVFRRHQQDPNDFGHILFLGRITPIKGIELIIEALPFTPEIKLKIAGPIESRAYYRSLQRKIRENSVNDRVQYIGAVSYEEVPILYSSALALVLPSSYENLGGVLLEAQASECPVIATDAGGMSEIIKNGETGFIIKERSHEMLAEKINLLFNDRSLRERMGLAGRKFVLSFFSAEAYVDRILDAYNSVIYN